jgi:AraC family transcriptional regulator of adaptative response/methylated-DNA-[protein]-cysteine methyltransferase
LKAELARRFPAAHIADGGNAMANELAGVCRQIENPGSDFDMPLDIRGTPFQQRVWDALRQIPAGSTQSYSDIANSLGLPGSVRAVAGACAANPIAIVIPCHRVIRTDGGLSGYRWGIERKRALLAREKAASDRSTHVGEMKLAAA